MKYRVINGGSRMGRYDGFIVSCVMNPDDILIDPSKIKIDSNLSKDMSQLTTLGLLF